MMFPAAHSFWQYLLLLPVAMVSGQMFAFVAGALVRYGYLSAPAMYAIFVLGDFIPDSLYYLIGRSPAVARTLHRWGLRAGITDLEFDAIRTLWQRHTLATMLAAKYSMALVGPILISAGLSKISVRRFYGAAIPITLVQYAAFMSLGYYFASSFGAVSSALKAVELGVAGALLLGLYLYFSRRIRDSWFFGHRARNYAASPAQGSVHKK